MNSAPANKSLVSLTPKAMARMERNDVLSLAGVLCLEKDAPQAIELLSIKTTALREPLHKAIRDMLSRLDENLWFANMAENPSIKAEFIPQVLASIHDHPESVDNEFDYWITQDELVMKAFERHAPGRLLQLVQSHPHPLRLTQTQRRWEWNKAKDAFINVPGLLETLVSHSAQNNTTSARGSIGILVAAALGDLELFKRCIFSLEKLGVSKESAVSTTWYNDEIFCFAYQNYNALFEALIQGHSDIAEYILSIAPALSLSTEVQHIQRLIGTLLASNEVDEYDKDHYLHVKEQTLAFALACEMRQSLITPQSYSSSGARHGITGAL